ncbi:[NiFe]-hydrogenase assembly chaperone HybE [Thiothrix nivea]|uniref:[NiFe]-hydrogenase assembly chaperone HybE n=1 Tax=Thiothrix nivea TaxID=1031 RepID=UPI000302FF11|nr:[NiFe]-hydrogenase assembly chaperone HybE [Thiothrix nivea]
MQADPHIAGLETYFREVEHTRMRDVPILNPRLQVEAVSFQPLDDGWLGVLISPWFMNLVWLPSVETGVVAAPDTLTLELPSGAYKCQRNHAPTTGDFYTCSLFSPVLQFADQAAAVLTARHVMLAVTDHRGHNPVIAQGKTSPVSRRDFLRGKFS